MCCVQLMQMSKFHLDSRCEPKSMVEAYVLGFSLISQMVVLSICVPRHMQRRISRWFEMQAPQQVYLIDGIAGRLYRSSPQVRGFGYCELCFFGDCPVANSLTKVVDLDIATSAFVARRFDISRSGTGYSRKRAMLASRVRQLDQG